MKPDIFAVVFTFLFSISFLPPVCPISCNKTQYEWPMDKPQLCCNMCPPGSRMEWRSTSICEIKCSPCSDDMYIDNYSMKLACDFCDNCNKPHMEYYSPCSTTRNAVCRCKAGYRCMDDSCKWCETIPSTTIKPTLPPSTTIKPTLPPSTTIKPTLPPSTTIKPTLPPSTTETTRWKTPQPVKDTVWFLVIIALLCAGITMVAVAKIKPFLLWIKSKHGFVLAKDPAPVSRCSEDEEVSTPIQEVLGKCEV